MERAFAVLLMCVCVEISALSGKDYFCRDPDTGKLYPTNSTWPSTTFCGNYTCKLKRKGFPPILPVRQLNISGLSMQSVERSSEMLDEAENEADKKSISKKSEVEDSNLDLNAKEILTQEENIPQIKLSKEHSILLSKLIHNSTTDNKDRYLSEKEIEAIVDLLHNVKKSDLYVIVDIYNLAQDIYKEMDKITNDKIIEETFDGASRLPVVQRINKGYFLNDMDNQASNAIPSTVSAANTNPYSHFQGSHPYNFGHYSYPLPLPQTQPSFSGQYRPQNKIPDAKPLRPPPYSAFPYQGQTYGAILMNPYAVEPPKSLKEPKPQGLLPYPFAFVQQHYNLSTYPFDYYLQQIPSHKCEQHKNQNQPAYSKPEISQIPAIHETEEESKNLENTQENKESVEEKFFATVEPSFKADTKKRPDWQTDPLPANVIDEIRAYIEKKNKIVKPLSLRKKVILEKVGKVVKFDELYRNKRSIDEDTEEVDEEYEPYIERTECPLDFTPGYFKMGDQTQPFPECCPQRLNLRR